MEETLEGGQGPPWAVAPLEREREKVCSNVPYEGKRESKNLYALFLCLDNRER
jgi:hypothetical protein